MSRFEDALDAFRDATGALLEWLATPSSLTEVAVCTVHGNTESYDGDYAKRFAWPRIQIEQLRRHTKRGYRVFAFANRLMPEHEEYLRSCKEVHVFSSKKVRHSSFDNVWPLRNWLVRHAIKTRRIIVHLDSDAFPVSNHWLQVALANLSYRVPVTAVQRLENGDSHSDRCFLVHTRGGFLRHAFDMSSVGVKDAGGGVSKYLESAGFGWNKLVRSNVHNYHQVIAAIYGDVIYHHGAGSRVPRFRANANLWNQENAWAREQEIHRVLTERIFEDRDAFLDELRGKRQPFDLEGAIRAVRGED